MRLGGGHYYSYWTKEDTRQGRSTSSLGFAPDWGWGLTSKPTLSTMPSFCLSKHIWFSWHKEIFLLWKNRKRKNTDKSFLEGFPSNFMPLWIGEYIPATFYKTKITFRSKFLPFQALLSAQMQSRAAVLGLCPHDGTASQAEAGSTGTGCKQLGPGSPGFSVGKHSWAWVSTFLCPLFKDIQSFWS